MAEHQPGTKGVAFTFDPHPEAVYRALVASACGVMNKSTGWPQWHLALEHVRLTGHHHNEYTQQALLHKPDPGSPLTLRQRAIASLSPKMLEFALKWTSDAEPTLKEVAREMNIKLNTVEGYRQDVEERIGVGSRTGILRFLIRFHILKP